MKQIILAVAILFAVSAYAQTPSGDTKQSTKKTEKKKTETKKKSETKKKTKKDDSPPSPPYADIQFETTTHNFGTVKNGPDVTYEFKFKNTGNSDLIITNAVAGCGCTTPEYPKEPVKPGQSGSIKVTFHTSGRPGPFNKSVTVTSNAKTATTLTLSIEGVVE